MFKFSTATSAIAAMIIAFACIVTLSSSTAFAQPKDPLPPSAPKEKTPLEQCEEDRDKYKSDVDAMIQHPECAAVLQNKKPPPPKTPVKPYRHMCEYGTTGKQGTVMHPVTGVRDCVCTNPERDEVVTQNFSSAGTVQICLPKDRDKSVTTVTKVTTICGDGANPDPAANGNCTCLDPTHRLFTGAMTTDTRIQFCLAPPRDPMKLMCGENTTGEIGENGHCSCSDPELTIVSGPFSEEAGIKIEKCIREGSEQKLSDLQIYAGAGILFGGRNGGYVGGGLTAGLLGWFTRVVGINVDVTLSANYEPEDAEQLGTLFAVEGLLGVAFRFGPVVLAPGFYGKQWNRVDANAAGLDGNSMGYQFGGGVNFILKPWEAPVAIKAHGDVGYGSVAGNTQGQPVEMSMVQGGGFVGLIFVGDIFINN